MYFSFFYKKNKKLSTFALLFLIIFELTIFNMHIAEFQIQNFKSFKNISIYFNDRVNILTGVNNVGKSTVLEAIALWQECYTNLLQQAGKATKGMYKQGDFTFGAEIGSYVSYNDIVSVRSPFYEDIFHNLDVKEDVVLRAKIAHNGHELWIGFGIHAANGGNYRIYLRNYKGFDYKLFNNRDFIKNHATFIKVLYASPIANILQREERAHILKIDFSKQAHTTQLVFRNRIEGLFQRRNELGNPYDTFCNQLSNVLLGTIGQISFQFPNNQELTLKLLMKVGSEQPKDVSLYGSGTLQIIEILLSIYEQKSELNIILLDEPDSHIHRQLQARLLATLNVSDNTQIFITTHNEAMIREANPSWIFHLEQSPEKTYYPIQQIREGSKGLLSSANSPVIQVLAGKGNGLDFINALESDVLFMVEGVNDALRIQKILSLRLNDSRKYAFWVMGNVDSIFDQISHYKTIFSQIKNDKTLWEKTFLVFDKDFLTDTQREKLLKALKEKLQLKYVHIWNSYCFDSTLFSSLSDLSKVLEKFIIRKITDVKTNDVFNFLCQEIESLANDIKNNRISELENKIRGEIGKRKPKFEALGFSNNYKIIEDDYHLQNAITKYINECCNDTNLHKIMTKEDCETVLKNVLTKFNIPFSMEGKDENTATLNDVFDTIDLTNRFSEWEFLLQLNN